MSLTDEERERAFTQVDEALLSSELYFTRQIQSLASTSHDPRAQAQIIRSLSPMIALLQESREVLRELRLEHLTAEDS